MSQQIRKLGSAANWAATHGSNMPEEKRREYIKAGAQMLSGNFVVLTSGARLTPMETIKALDLAKQIIESVSGETSNRGALARAWMERYS